METLFLLGHFIFTFRHLLLGRQAKLPPSFSLEKLINDDLKSKTGSSHFYIQIANRSPPKFLLNVDGGGFPPFLLLHAYLPFHQPEMQPSWRLGSKQDSTAYCECECETGKDSWSHCPELWLTLPHGIRWQFKHLLLFQHIQTLFFIFF